MHNFALTTDGRPPREVELALLPLLPALDVRLWPYGARQAIIRAPLVHALETVSPGGAGPLLQRLGVEEMRPLSDAATLALLAGRDRLHCVPRDTSRSEGAQRYDSHLRQIRVPQAWRWLDGPARIDWQGLRVGQIDTGYTPHTAFGFPGRSWIDGRQAATFVEQPGHDEVSMLPSEPGAGVDPLGGGSQGHGTRVASVLCGFDPAARGGPLLGVAPRVPLVPVRIGGATWINEAQRPLARALQYLVVEARVRVISVGVGIFGVGILRPVREAVNAAYEAGVIVVCAAGNHVNGVVGPARLTRTVSVGGVTQDDRPWAGSGFGARVDVSAPATGIRRAETRRADDFDYGADGDGTSYAAALASGVAALWLAANASLLDARYPEPWQRVAAFKALVAATARQPEGWPQTGHGAGVLDAERLLAAPLPPAAGLNREPAA